jgi:hypothetical protein
MKEKDCDRETGVNVGYRNWTAIENEVRKRQTDVKDRKRNRTAIEEGIQAAVVFLSLDAYQQHQRY